MLVPVSARPAPIQTLSTRNPSAPQSATGNGNSAAPTLSSDGRFVVFSSSASDLVTNDNGNFGLDVFLRDRSSNTTVLVSANFDATGGGNGSSTFGSVSTNGRYVVFESEASDLVSGDTNQTSDVFVRDLWTQTTALVSVSTNGNSGNGISSDAVISADGRYVAFLSAADNLTANDINGLTDVFVRDLVLGKTTLVSVGATSGTVVSSPAITPDGRYVAFSSDAHGLASGVPSNPLGQVYVRDRSSNATIWASTNAARIMTNALQKTTATATSGQASISDDGRFVVFKSFGTNSSNRRVTLIMEFDVQTKTTSLISTSGVSVLYSQNDDFYGPEMSPDGRFVAYAAQPDGTNTTVIQLWDSSIGTNILISADLDGNFPTNSISYSAKVSADGQFVSFLSNATNLVANTVSNGFHVYLRDVQAGVTQLIDADTNGFATTDHWGTVPVLSSNGQFVAFCSLDASLVGADNNGAFDVYVRDTVGGSMELISQRNPLMAAQTGNTLSFSGPFSVSADGRWVAFASLASDLVTNDFNNERDVFVHDGLTGSNLLVSIGTDGNSALGGNSVTPLISADGRHVVFVSLATNLVADATNSASGIFRRDLQTGTTEFISGSLGGTNDASAPTMSADGQFVAFLGFTNSSSTLPATFWCDIAGGTISKLTAASPFAPSLSGDGQHVAFFNNRSNLLVWDAQLGANIYTNSTAISSATISPNGTRVACQTAARQLYICDLAAGTNALVASNVGRIRSSSQWSGDGRYFAFISTSHLIAADTNSTGDIYLWDVQTGTTTLISANTNGAAAGNGASDWPVISSDGRSVVFRSFATDVVAGIGKPPSIVGFDRLTGATSLLTTGSPGSGWTSWISQPTINSNAAVVTFQSWDSGLITSDLNRAADVFSEPVTVVSMTDSDADGIPDWWTQLYFGHPTGQAADQSLAGDDSDGDGMSNVQEYQAGTVPTDPGSIFKVTITSAAAVNGTVELIWPAVPGRSYQVQYTDDLSNPAWLDAGSGPSVIGNHGSYASSPLASGRYYRVVLVN